MKRSAEIGCKFTWLFIAGAACLVYGLCSGLKGNYGIMLQSIVENSGVEYANVSFVFAVGQLTVGLVQPLFGALALKNQTQLR